MLRTAAHLRWRNVTHHPMQNLTHRVVDSNARWSWREAQLDFVNCTSGATPHPSVDRFASWHSTSALGNALNVWVQLFLFALVSGRQLLVGAGIVPELLCGDNGAYVCGVDSEAKEWRKTKSRGTADWRDLFSNKQITDSPLNWFQYANVGAAVMRGVPAAEIDVNFKALCLECIYRSLRCPVVNAHNGLDRESCVMLRAMQLLLPGTMLRDRFSRAARITAAERWLGVIQDLDIVLKHSTAPDTATQRKFDWDRHIFFDPPTSRLDASTRFAGAIHIRALPPKLERDGSDIHQKHYIQFMGQLNSTHASFWVCAAKNALLADDQHRREQWPRSIFIATDSEGLCRMARNRLSLGLDDNDDPRAMFLRKGPVAHSDKATAAEQDIFRNPIACMDVSPTHLVKTERIHAQVKGGLDSHQLTILDWHFLARSRWLVSVTRIVNRCQRGAERDGTHNVGGPGRSFYGWALAASGLVHPPPNVHTKGCPCQLDGRTVSIWYPPGLNRMLRRLMAGTSWRNTSFPHELQREEAPS